MPFKRTKLNLLILSPKNLFLVLFAAEEKFKCEVVHRCGEHQPLLLRGGDTPRLCHVHLLPAGYGPPIRK